MSTKSENNQSSLVTCKKCGWVHFSVSMEYTLDEVKKFNEYFDSLSQKEQLDYYGGKKSNVDHYLHCLGCGNSYINFKDYKKGDCPDGVTMNPILHYNCKGQ